MNEINIKNKKLDPENPDDLVKIVGELVIATNYLSKNFNEFREKDFKPLNHAVRDHMVTKAKLDVFIDQQEQIMEQIAFIKKNDSKGVSITKRLGAVEKVYTAGSFIFKHSKKIITILAFISSISFVATVDIGDKLYKLDPNVKEKISTR